MIVLLAFFSAGLTYRWIARPLGGLMETVLGHIHAENTSVQDENYALLSSLW